MITLTKTDIIEKAKTYIPLERKHIWARNVAAACTRNVVVTGNDNGSVIAVPDRCEENSMARTMALASALAQNYLGIWDEEYVMQAADYDEVLSSHLIGQLERMKRDAEIKDKVFDLLEDYTELKKMLNTEIYTRLGHLNDPISRMLIAFQSQDPARFQDVAESAKELGLMVKDWEKKKAGRIAGDVAKAERKKRVKSEEREEEWRVES